MLTFWLVVGLVLWPAAALFVAVVIGKGIRIADQRSSAPDLDARFAATPHRIARPERSAARAATGHGSGRRAVGLTGIGAGLAAVAVSLQVSAYVAELRDVSGVAGRLLSMDGPGALSRLYVTGLFAAAALVAAIGAGRSRRRRAWWGAVSAVAVTVAGIKGGVAHWVLFDRLSSAISFEAAVLVSILLAAATVGGLWWLSRHERRDRTRVLGALALYAGASVVLSAVSSVARGIYGGSVPALTATFVEESLEGLAAVAFFAAVLVGVAPRLVLPAEWALRRAGDDTGLVAPGLSGPTPAGPGNTSTPS